MSKLKKLEKAVADAKKAHNAALLDIPNHPARPSCANVNAVFDAFDAAWDALYDAEKEKRKYKKEQENG